MKFVNSEAETCASDDLEPVSVALAKLTDDHRYSLSELQQRPLPEGVDAQRLEMYLTDTEFEVHMRLLL